jgi:hypothetical protein
MKVTVDIDDQHYEEFLELLKTLDYAKATQDYGVPEWQQEMVMERAAKIDRGEMKLIEVDEALRQIFDEE